MKCPICKRETLAEFRPFCSKHCSDVDLAKWLTGAYAVPVTQAEDDSTWDTKPPSEH